MNEFHAFDNAVMARVTSTLRKVAIIPLTAIMLLTMTPIAHAGEALPLKQYCNSNKGMIAQQAKTVREINAIMNERDDKAELDIWVARWSEGEYGDFIEMLNAENAICAEVGISVTPAEWRG